MSKKKLSKVIILGDSA